MVDRGVLSRFRLQRDLTAYHRRISGAIGRAPALRALPQLLKVALPITGPDGALTPLRAALARHPYVTLAGRPGSGRELVMQQLALYHGRRADPAGALPALLALPQTDDGCSPPSQLLDAALSELWRELPPPPLLAVRRATRPAAPLPNGGGTWLLLVHGWELLPPARRAAWREALLELAARGAALRAVVSLPPAQSRWDGFRPLHIAAPPPELVARWIHELCPPAARETVTAALAPGGPLETCADRLFEVALVCWLAARTGVPATRAELYERALTAVHGGSHGGGDSWHPQLARYLLARRAVAEAHYALLADLPAPDRAETALLAAELAPDPAPVLAALWRASDHHADTTLGLARCLRANPNTSPAWTALVATRLARLARPGEGPDGVEALRLLRALLPALDASLVQLARRARPVRQLLARLLRALPADLALPRAEMLALADVAAPPQAWAAADVLAELCAGGNHAPPPPADQRARARWAYACIIAAHSGPAAVTVADVLVLRNSGAGDKRLAAAGAALLRDGAQPEALRLAAVELLDRCDTPSARAAIRSACADRAPAVRQAAHAALARRDPHAASDVLAAAVQDADSWELRLEAMLLIGRRGGADAGALVATYACDEQLPLVGRLRLLRALGGHAPPALLFQIADDERQPELVRAAAIRAAARTAGPAALLAAPDAPPWRVAAMCDGLAARGRQPDTRIERMLLPTLEPTIERGDLAVAHAIIRALGATGSDASIAALGALLDPADIARRLHRPAAALIDTALATCLADTRLPPALRLPIETALARALTPADRPSTLREFLTAEGDDLRATAARALGTIGAPDAAAQLRASLRHAAGPASVPVLTALGGIAGLAALGELLADSCVPQGVRWQIAQHIAGHQGGAELLRDLLDRPDVDPFTRGALVEGIGRSGARAVLLELLRLLRNPDTDRHVLAQAVAALGALDDPAAESELLRLAADPARDDELRGDAAANLPRALRDEGRRALRDLLRTERAPGPVVAGALRALGRARDREALALALRFCLDGRPEVVRAAIGALADIGDETVTPVLAHAAQSPALDHVARLQAIGALLRLGGREHALLLQTYLAHASPLLQLRALDELIGAGAPADEIAALAVDRARTLPLRLRALEYVAAAHRNHDEGVHEGPEGRAHQQHLRALRGSSGGDSVTDALVALLASDGDDLQLRCRAAMALGAGRASGAVAALCALARADETPAPLRLRCIEALGRVGGDAAWDTLSQLIGRGEQDAARAWAAQALAKAGEAEP